MAIRDAAAADTPSRRDPLASEKARRIVEAMRICIGKYGPVNSTFDVVAKEAGVSRGLLHYYFGSKERLMVEVLRSDALDRVAAIRAVSPHINSADELMDVFVGQMHDWLAHNPESYALVFEMLVESRRNEEIGDANREMRKLIEDELAAVLRRLQDDGAIVMRGSANSCSLALFAMGHGLAMEMLSDPDADHEESQARIVEAGLYLLGKNGD